MNMGTAHQNNDRLLRESLQQVGYLADADLATTVWLAGELERPLLLEGDAGVGKTALATALAQAKDAVLASDAFFPFRDNVDVAAKAGISALIQPGGSVKDAEVIAAADEHGLAMVFTGQRHFRH